MDLRIIYPLDGGVAVIIPAPGAGLSIDDIAAKDTPAGVPFRIVGAADIPADRSMRALWTADFSAPDGFGLGAVAFWASRTAQESGE
jgi:hypothetical protein